MLDKKRNLEDMEEQNERRKLEDFVRKHYYLTGDGQVSFHCQCQNPENCSEWLHRPDIDEIIVQLIHGTSTFTEEDDALLYRFVTSLWSSINVVWAFFCWTKTTDNANRCYYEGRHHPVGCFLADELNVLFLVNLVCFVTWIIEKHFRFGKEKYS